MNLAPLVDAVAGLGGACLTVCTPIITAKLLSYFKVNLDAQHRDALNTALENALGEALKFGQTAGDSTLTNVTIKNAALSQAVAYVTANAPDALAYFGLTQADIAQKVGNKLATLLHTTGAAPAADPAKAASTAEMLAKVAPAPILPAAPAVA